MSCQIGGGDDIELVICFQCGQIQDWKSVLQESFNELFSVDNRRNYSFTLKQGNN